MRWLLTVFAFFFLCFPLFAADKLIINADRLKRIPSLNLVVAEGHVRIVYKDIRLEADEVRLNAKTRDVVAEGNVVLWQKNSFLSCKRLEFNLDTKEGVAYRATGFLPPYYYFAGERIKRLSGGIYNIRKGMLTTCETDWRACSKYPDWSFKGSRVIIKENRYARIYNLSGWIKKIPVLYLPFVSFPVTKERKTGFLFPRFGWKQDHGLFVNIPFFWAISRDKDATFWFKPYSGGDYKVAAEYRQRFSKDEKLWLYGDYFDETESVGKNRWNLKGNAFKRFPWGFEFTGKLDMTSTTKYRKEFSGSFSSYTKRHNDSYGVFVRRFSSSRLSLLARYQDDVEEDYEEKIYKFPQVDWELYPVKLLNTPFYLEGKAQYLKYRNKNDTARFDYKVSRWDFYPKLSLPITPAPWFSVTPRYGLRYTVWSKRLDRHGGEVENPTSRLIYTFDVRERGPLLYKLFRFGNSTIRHDVIPEVKYEYVPDETKAQRDTIRFDEVDFLSPKNLVTYSLTNRFVDEDSRREILKLKLEQSYDILKDRRGEPYKFSDLMFEADAYPGDDLSLQYRMYQSVYGFGITRWSFKGRVKRRVKNFLPSLAVTYYYEKFSGNRYIEYNPAVSYKDVLSFAAYWRRDIYNSYWVERRWELRIKGKCWSIAVGYRVLDNRLSSSRNDRMITFLVILRGLGEFGVGGK